MHFAYFVACFVSLIMRVNLIKWVNVLDAIEHDKEMLKAFSRFYYKLRDVTWEKPSDVFDTFNSADLVKCSSSNRLVFNVGGNKYRLVAGYFFAKKFVNLYVQFVGTHKQYDSVSLCDVDMFRR